MRVLGFVWMLSSMAVVAGGCTGDDSNAVSQADAQVPPADGPDATSGDTPGGPPYSVPTNPQITSFFDAFHASRYSQASSTAAVLDQAAMQTPTDGPLSFVRFLDHFWHLSEAGRDPTQSGSALSTEAMDSLGLIMTAKANNPTDPRVDCFLGIDEVETGQATKNDALVQQGMAAIDRSVQAWPQFSLFCKALVYDTLPVTDPNFQLAVDAMYGTFAACFGEPADPDNPDITKYLDQATSVGPNRACWNDWIAPHNAEGTYLFIGDLLVKQGNVAAAKVAYNDAKLIKEYPQWPYQSILEERLSSDLNATSQLYRDSDPTNDPPIGGNRDNRGCAVCHAATAAE